MSRPANVAIGKKSDRQKSDRRGVDRHLVDHRTNRDRINKLTRNVNELFRPPNA